MNPKRWNRLLALSALCISCAASADSAPPIPKQLAGPASEFAQMRLPEARATAARSTSALLPVELSPTQNGDWQWQSRLALDGDNPRFIVFSGEDASWNTLLSTDEKRLAERAEQLADESGPIEYGMANERFDGRVFRKAPGS